jgi:hypothetical protein
MPLQPTSRYQGLPAFSAADAKGMVHPTVAIRLVPAPAVGAAIYQRPITRGDTVESLAAQYYAISDWWWRIADVNAPIFPLDFQPGDIVGIPSVADAGLVVRSRRF